MRLPVHCCCEPAKRLGWLEVDDHYAKRGHCYMLARVAGFYETVDITIEYVQLVLYPRRLLNCGHYTIQLSSRRLAVKSDDRPLEEWRRLPDFTEGRDATS